MLIRYENISISFPNTLNNVDVVISASNCKSLNTLLLKTCKYHMDFYYIRVTSSTLPAECFRNEISKLERAGVKRTPVA